MTKFGALTERDPIIFQHTATNGTRPENGVGSDLFATKLIASVRTESNVPTFSEAG